MTPYVEELGWHPVSQGDCPCIGECRRRSRTCWQRPCRVADIYLASWAVAMLVVGAGLSVPNVEPWVFKK